MRLPDRRPVPADEGAVATKAVLRAGARLGVPHRTLGRIIGLSEATMSRMGWGAHPLAPGDKPFELALIFVRLYRSLDAMAAGDDATASAWLRAENAALGGTPLSLIQSV